MSSTINVGTGTTAHELEKTINNASKGTTIKLESGHYSFDDSITITRSDVSLVGAGSGKTTLTFTNKALDNNDSYGIHLDGSDAQFIGRLDSSASEGKNNIKLDNGNSLKPGDTVRIWQDNDSAYFKEIGDTSWRESNAPLRTSMAKVKSVNGDSVTLDRGVHFDFDSGKTKVESLDTVNNVSLKGFSIDFELGTPDNKTFENTLSGLKDYQAIWVDGTVDSQLFDIQVINGPSIAYHFDKTLDTDADHIEAHGSFNKGSGGNGYSYELRESYDGSYTNLADSGMRHGLIFASWRSSVGNNAHVKSTDRDINFHGGQDHNNTVHVEQSIRDAEADVMSTTLWYNNGGESFGAITEAGANLVTFDYVVGSRRDDILQASDTGVYLDGGLGHDTLTGGRGNDILQGGPKDDWGKNKLDGGAGDDIAMYLQSYADLDVSINGSKVSVDKDTLTNIEQIVFGDGTLLDVSSGNISKGDKAKVPSAADILGDISFSGSGNASPSRAPEKTSSTSESTASDGSFNVTSNVTSSWNDGYTAEVFVENTSGSDITPELRFDLPADIDTVWNGLVSEDGDGYRVTDNNPNTLAPGETWRFAYRAYGEDQSLPDAGQAQSGVTSASRDSSSDNASDSGKGSGSDADIAVSGRVTNEWNDGYVTEIFVKNASDHDIVDPEIQFDLPADIDTVWNGLVIDEGDDYRVTDNNPNTLEPGEVWRFAYKAYGDEKSLPNNASVQGDGADSMVAQLLGIDALQAIELSA